MSWGLRDQEKLNWWKTCHTKLYTPCQVMDNVSWLSGFCARLISSSQTSPTQNQVILMLWNLITLDLEPLLEFDGLLLGACILRLRNILGATRSVGMACLYSGFVGSEEFQAKHTKRKMHLQTLDGCPTFYIHEWCMKYLSYLYDWQLE